MKNSCLAKVIVDSLDELLIDLVFGNESEDIEGMPELYLDPLYYKAVEEHKGDD
jgi:hypothetical protein